MSFEAFIQHHGEFLRLPTASPSTFGSERLSGVAAGW
jgi:hypothetical protein